MIGALYLQRTARGQSPRPDPAVSIVKARNKMSFNKSRNEQISLQAASFSRFFAQR